MTTIATLQPLAQLLAMIGIGALAWMSGYALGRQLRRGEIRLERATIEDAYRRGITQGRVDAMVDAIRLRIAVDEPAKAPPTHVVGAKPRLVSSHDTPA